MTTIPKNITDDSVATIEKSIGNEVNDLMDYISALMPIESKLRLAHEIVNVLGEVPTAATIELIDWSEEALEGQFFDVTLHTAFDSDGQIVGNVGHFVSDAGYFTYESVRVTSLDDLNELRVNEQDPNSPISVEKTLTWLSNLVEEHNTDHLAGKTWRDISNKHQSLKTD